jgi:hypothetical protein
MYGLINQAIRNMLLANHGEEAWIRVRLWAGVEVERFEALALYPDGFTDRT